MMRDKPMEFSTRKNRYGVGPLSETGELMRPLSSRVWLLLCFASLATFAVFFVLDPNPSVLLSVCVAVNVAVMGWAMMRLYQLELLLSPMMLVYVGPLMFLYYTWGNLGARIAGETRYSANFGTLDYYPLSALLSTIGLILYCWVVFGVFKGSLRRVSIRFQDLYWRPGQVTGAIFLVFAIFMYLSVKYSFVGGYFRSVESNLDRWLIAAMNSFAALIAIISTSLLARSETKRGRLLAIAGIVLALVLTIGLRSRTLMLVNLTLIALCWLTLKPAHAKLSFFLAFAVLGGAIFGLGTVVKTLQSGNDSILSNLSLLSSVDSADVLSLTTRGVDLDRQYRTAGFELPSAILQCLDHGAEPAYGDLAVGAFYQGLPGFIRPPGLYSERTSIILHYWRYCWFYGDSIALPLASGIGDWGIPGVFIHLLFGVFSIALWKLAQRSPRLYLAYLLVPLFPDHLFWTGVFHYVKTMSFLWLFLWVTGALLMPRWEPPSNPEG